jgi:alcohol dehydrogenase class IV
VIISGEPTYERIKEATRIARETDSQFVIGFGGGSVLDAGKAIAAMLTNPGELIDYLEIVGNNRPISTQAAPYLAIPTTSGTGSEVTKNAVLQVEDKKIKVSMRSVLMLPTISLVDPELTLSIPSAVTAASGLDALTQVIEPYVSIKANPMVDMFCLEGIRNIFFSIETACNEGANLKAREAMAWGSLLGGLSLANAGLGTVHGFSSIIGGMFNIPHGVICARLLPIVMEANIKSLIQQNQPSQALNRYREIAAIVTKNENAKIEEGFIAIKELVNRLKIKGFSSYGITNNDFPVLIKGAMGANSTKANPVQLTEDELTEILEKAL